MRTPTKYAIGFVGLCAIGLAFTIYNTHHAVADTPNLLNVPAGRQTFFSFMLTRRYTWAYAVPFVLTLVLPVWWLRNRLRPATEGICPTCGYDLTGNTSGVCPGCGTRMEQETKVSP